VLQINVKKSAKKMNISIEIQAHVEQNVKMEKFIMYKNQFVSIMKNALKENFMTLKLNNVLNFVKREKYLIKIHQVVIQV